MTRPSLLLRPLAAALLVLASCLPAAEPPEGTRARVVWVVDGDTITVRIGETKERVRLIGIDTPELADLRAPWRRAAYAARDYAIDRLKRRTVTLVADPGVGDRDDYGRLLRYVVLSDGTDFNEEMIRRGLARAFTRFPFGRKARYRAAEQEPRASRTGVWALPPGPSRVTGEDRR